VAQTSFLCYLRAKPWNSANVWLRFLLPALYVGVAAGKVIRFPGVFPTEREAANVCCIEPRHIFGRRSPGVVGYRRMQRHARHQNSCPVEENPLTRHPSEGAAAPADRPASASAETGSHRNRRECFHWANSLKGAAAWVWRGRLPASPTQLRGSLLCCAVRELLDGDQNRRCERAAWHYADRLSAKNCRANARRWSAIA